MISTLGPSSPNSERPSAGSYSSAWRTVRSRVAVQRVVWGSGRSNVWTVAAPLGLGRADRDARVCRVMPGNTSSVASRSARITVAIDRLAILDCGVSGRRCGFRVGSRTREIHETLDVHHTLRATLLKRFSTRPTGAL